MDTVWDVQKILVVDFDVVCNGDMEREREGGFGVESLFPFAFDAECNGEEHVGRNGRRGMPLRLQ